MKELHIFADRLYVDSHFGSNVKGQMRFTLEGVDKHAVLDSLELEPTDVMPYLDAIHAVDHFGENLIRALELDPVIEHFGIDEVLGHIGVEEILEYLAKSGAEHVEVTNKGAV